MEFSTKAEKLQPNQAGAALFICTEEAQLHNDTALALFRSLEEGQSFAETNIPSADGLQAVAVVYLNDLERTTFDKAAAEAAKWAQKQEKVGVDIMPFCEINAPRVAEAFAVAFGNAAYRFDRYKKEAKPAKLTHTTFHTEHTEKVDQSVKVADAQVFGQNLCRDLGNAAPNECTPEFLAATAKSEAERLGAQAKIIEKDYIKANMGSFWAVAKGSVQDPYLVELSYFGAADQEAAPIVLVGKGITFDTGGISIKPAAAMDEMKFDMCGAASVLGVFTALAQLQPAINVVGLIPACENMPDGAAVKPGDVVTSMSGQTIEILNTDAEGRLVLCDTLTYAQRFKPAALIDIATLTGACVIALGGIRSGLYATDDALAQQLQTAGEQTLDLCWRMPLDEDYGEGLKSNFADVGNVAGRAGGSITAAKFLQRFVGDAPWAHLDIAGTAWKEGAAKGATGRPVALLLHYLLQRAA